jgi:predicted HTH transcriptional regulator
MNIEQLITSPESKTLEFKRDLSSPRPILKTLLAFANTAGGRLIVGVADDRQVIGVEHPLDEEERLCSLIADSIAPRLVPNVELMTVEGKTLLVVEVFLSGLRPHYLKAEGSENGVYVRLGSTNRQADRELIAELRRSAEGIAFDELPMPELSIDDLDLAAVKSLFRWDRKLGGEELITLKLLTHEQGRVVPTKGAVLLFGKDRIRYFPDAWMQCGRFMGQDKARSLTISSCTIICPGPWKASCCFLKNTPCAAPIFQKSDVKMSGVFLLASCARWLSMLWFMPTTPNAVPPPASLSSMTASRLKIPAFFFLE